MNAIVLHSGASLPTRTLRRLGLAASTLAILFLLADAGAEMFAIPPVIAGAAQIGFPVAAAFWQAIGAILPGATVLYAIPRTALLGAVIVTGYLGGAICAHVRLGEDVVGPTLVSLVVATLTWAGLALRDGRVRALVLAD